MLHSSGSSYAPGGVPLGQSASDGIGYTPAVSSAPHQPHQPHQQQQSAYGYVFEGQAQSQRQQQQDFYIQPHQSHQMHQQLYPSQAHQAHQGPQGPQGLPSTASYFGAPTATTTAAAAAAAAPAAAFQPQATALQYHTHTPVASSLAPASGQHQYQTPAPPANAAFTGAGSTTPLTAASLTAAINSAAAAASEGATAFNATYGTPVSQLQPQSAHHADPSRTPASSATPLTYSTQTQAGLPSQARVAAYSTPLPPRSLSDHSPPPSQPGQPQSGSPASANAAIHTFAGTMSTPQQDRSSSTPYRDQATLSSNTSTSSRAGASLLGTPAMQQPSHPGAAYSNLPTQQHAQPTGALASGAAAAAAAPSQQSAPANNNVPPSVMQLLSEHVLKEAGLISANERLESLLGEERLERQSFERRTRELAESKDRRIRDLETQLETLRPLQTASNFVDQRVLVSQLEQELDRVLALLERERSQWQQQRESDSAESNRRFAALEADAAAERRATERAQSERANLEVTVNGLRQEWQSAQSDLTNQLHSAQANVAQLTASLQGANSRLAAAVRDAEQVRGALQTSTTENTRLSQQLMSCESALRQAQSDLQALESDRTVQLQHLRDRFKQQFDSALDVVSDAIQSTPGSSYSSRSSYLGAALPAASSNGRTVGAELFPPLTPAATTTGSAAITPSSFARQNGGVVAGSGIATGPTPVPQQPPYQQQPSQQQPSQQPPSQQPSQPHSVGMLHPTLTSSSSQQLSSSQAVSQPQQQHNSHGMHSNPLPASQSSPAAIFQPYGSHHMTIQASPRRKSTGATPPVSDGRPHDSFVRFDANEHVILDGEVTDSDDDAEDPVAEPLQFSISHDLSTSSNNVTPAEAFFDTSQSLNASLASNASYSSPQASLQANRTLAQLGQVSQQQGQPRQVFQQPQRHQQQPQQQHQQQPQQQHQQQHIQQHQQHHQQEHALPQQPPRQPQQQRVSQPTQLDTSSTTLSAPDQGRELELLASAPALQEELQSLRALRESVLREASALLGVGTADDLIKKTSPPGLRQGLPTSSTHLRPALKVPSTPLTANSARLPATAAAAAGGSPSGAVRSAGGMAAASTPAQTRTAIPSSLTATPMRSAAALRAPTPASGATPSTARVSFQTQSPPQAR